MKKFILIALLFSVWQNKACTQTSYFEGVITSRIKFEIKDSTKRAVYFSKINPSHTIEHFYTGNSFVVNDKGDTENYLYLQSENKAYDKVWGKDTFYMMDCSKKGKQMLSYTIEKNADTILDIPCNKLQVRFEDRTSTYFYNEAYLKINPKWYESLTYVNWDTISKIIRSIPLQIIIERSDYRRVLTVESFTEKKVDKNLFKIPITAIIKEY